ncbi:MAG: amidohydrolase family protein [Pseudomonadota bacterium]
MIDAHHHLWDLQAVHYPWLMERGGERFFGDPTSIQRNYLQPEFIAEAGAEGITASVHVQVGAEDGLAEATWVDAQHQMNPAYPAAQVAFCDLTDPERARALDALQELPTVRGIRQITGRKPKEDAKLGTHALLETDSYYTGLDELATRGLSYDIQLIPEQMQRLAQAFAERPSLQVALCHAGSPYDRSDAGLATWRAGISAMAACPNVVCKISGFGMFDPDWTKERIAPFVAHILAEFGAERALFGSNFPVDKIFAPYAQMTDAVRDLVPEADLKAVFETTAQRFYRLG